MKINKIRELISKGLKNKEKRYRTNEDIDMYKINEFMKKENTILIDVRSKQEYDEYHIPGAILIPSYEIDSKVRNIVSDKQANIILYCQSGIRSKKALEVLKEQGYSNVYNLQGGLDEL